MLQPVVVLAGGLSHQRDISLKSGRTVAQALRRVGHEVVEADIDSSLIETLRCRRVSHVARWPWRERCPA
ncbi:hypothetical protein E5345_09605 [Propionibacterium sp. NM47_B9-13]|uniref:D-alanine--D-alanine ligase N-terminal domain-containing protein n=2 Tax=Cutibacterium modestum TaxID=2559073 RepID=A0AAD1KSC6_9ACTN|nr:hypothetical protein HMPREF9621_02809 [Cutibacterium modestum HL037PA2]EFS92995.1 hypothetical protein HMPREF9607_00846 [Cutibacterium modestum HL044PA1]EFT14984.1 hypothetical protein HMPREF9622_01951 [Cutibacterium modestum HL037PA3]REB73099.1 hypothetical protein CP877_12490 [Cutibacterium modestum]TGY28311.1 hypothetical protein E5345_09605 [Propionibacterium sp. NM47_B9-13]